MIHEIHIDVSTWRGKQQALHFPIVTDTDFVPVLKWRYQSSRIQNHRATVGDTGMRCLKY